MERITLTPEEAAERLGVSRASIFKAMKAGEVPSVTIGRRRFVPVALLEKALIERSTPIAKRTGRTRAA